MPHYFFHVRVNDAFDEDFDGVEFPSLEFAFDAATRAAQEMVSEKVLRGDIIENDRFEITSDDGTVLLEVPFRSVVRLE